MKYEEILNIVANDLQLPVDLVRNTYKAYWQFIRSTIQSLPLKEDLDEEEFDKLKVNFNIPSLGKLYCTRDRYVGVKKRFEHIKNIMEKNVKS